MVQCLHTLYKYYCSWVLFFLWSTMQCQICKHSRNNLSEILPPINSDSLDTINYNHILSSLLTLSKYLVQLVTLTENRVLIFADELLVISILLICKIHSLQQYWNYHHFTKFICVFLLIVLIIVPQSFEIYNFLQQIVVHVHFK